jgi:hypothetical protein
MIDLNESSYDGGGDVSIFNDGNAGVVENVTLSIIKKGKDDKETAPEYKLVFTDESGASCNMAFWYITEDTAFKTVTEQEQRLGKIMKHVAHVILGNDFTFPKFENGKQLLDGMMKLFNKGLSGAPKIRVFANYGVNDFPKEYIQIRTWVPFMESMDTEAGKLKAGSLDCMVRLKADAPVPAGEDSEDDEAW